MAATAGELTAAPTAADGDLTAALRRWLDRHPVALVGLLDQHGQLLPWPASVELGPGHRLDDRSLLDLVVDHDRTPLAGAFLDAIDKGVATTSVHMASTPDEVVAVHYFDVRQELGGLVRLCWRGDEAAASAPLPAHEARRPRTAAVTKGDNGMITAVDDDFVRMLGWAADELVGSRSLGIIHPDDHSRAVDGWMRLMAQGGRHTTRLRHRRSDGTWVWLEVCNELVPGADGVEVRSQVVDISEEMRATDALRQHEELLRRVTEAVPVGLAHLGPDGGVTYANSALLRQLGQPGLDTLDDLLSALPTDSAGRLATAVEGVMRSGCDVEVTLEVATATGGLLRCRSTLSAVVDGSHVVGVLFCMVDVTELAARASYDALTGTLNRGSILAALEQALAVPGTTVGLAFVDLDRFKLTNDTLGHAAGDELLRRVAAAITSAVRGDDRVGRLGGDEFLVVLPAVTGLAQAQRAAERVKDRIASCGASASVGVEVAIAGTITADELLARADEAMYRVKRRAAPEG